MPVTRSDFRVWTPQRIYDCKQATRSQPLSIHSVGLIRCLTGVDGLPAPTEGVILQEARNEQDICSLRRGGHDRWFAHRYARKRTARRRCVRPGSGPLLCARTLRSRSWTIRRFRQLRMGEPAFLGRPWLAGPPGARLRLRHSPVCRNVTWRTSLELHRRDSSSPSHAVSGAILSPARSSRPDDRQENIKKHQGQEK